MAVVVFLKGSTRSNRGWMGRANSCSEPTLGDAGLCPDNSCLLFVLNLIFLLLQLHFGLQHGVTQKSFSVACKWADLAWGFCCSIDNRNRERQLTSSRLEGSQRSPREGLLARSSRAAGRDLCCALMYMCDCLLYLQIFGQICQNMTLIAFFFWSAKPNFSCISSAGSRWMGRLACTDSVGRSCNLFLSLREQRGT